MTIGDASKTIEELRAEIAQLREMVSSRAHPGKLSATKIAKLISDAKAGKLKKKTPWFGDGGNLALQITKNGARVSWVFRWREPRRPGEKRGKDRVMGLGSLATIDLPTARARAHKYRMMLDEGKDPRAERDGARLDEKIARDLVKTVREVADIYLKAKIARKSEGYRRSTIRELNIVLPPIYDWPVQKVTRNTILDTCGIRERWVRTNETARRALMHLERMFKLAISEKFFYGENPAKWKDGIEHSLPAIRDVREVKHHALLNFREAPRYMNAVRAYTFPRTSPLHKLPGRPVIGCAAEFIMLTGVRVGEVLKAQWKEFDIVKKIWTVPKEHTKAKRADRPLPITKSMLAVLEERQKRRRRTDQSRDALVFPSPYTGKVFHHSTVLRFIRDRFLQLYLSVEHPRRERTTLTKAQIADMITVHGSRSVLQDFVRAKGFSNDWYRIQVDHALGDAVDQAYGPDKLIEERRGMMEEYDEFLSTPAPEPKAAKVIGRIGPKSHIADKRRRA
jgi:integrase